MEPTINLILNKAAYYCVDWEQLDTFQHFYLSCLMLNSIRNAYISPYLTEQNSLQSLLNIVDYEVKLIWINERFLFII